MASIRETITSALPGDAARQYSQHIDRVVGALEHREAGIREQVVAQARSMGVPEDRAHMALTNAGVSTGRPQMASQQERVTDPAYAQVPYDNGNAASEPVSGDVQQQILAVLQRIESRVR